MLKVLMAGLTIKHQLIRFDAHAKEVRERERKSKNLIFILGVGESEK